MWNVNSKHNYKHFKKMKMVIYEEKQRVKSTIEQRFGTQLYTNKLKLTSTLNRAKFQYKSTNTHIQWITAILFSVLTYLTCATSSVYGYVAIFLRKHHHYQIWFSSILREICVAMTCVTSNLLICQNQPINISPILTQFTVYLCKQVHWTYPSKFLQLLTNFVKTLFCKKIGWSNKFYLTLKYFLYCRCFFSFFMLFSF